MQAQALEGVDSTAIPARFRLTFPEGTLQCDGRQFLIRGYARLDANREIQIDTVIPILAVTRMSVDARAGRGGAGSIFMSVWDGPEVRIGLPEDVSAEDAQGIQGLAAAVQVQNASWPMSSSRALAARRQISPGYFREPRLVGDQGCDEFMSPLSRLDVAWIQAWRQAGLSGVWPLGAVPVVTDEGNFLLGVLEDRLEIVDSDARSQSLTYSECAEPRVACKGTWPPFEMGLHFSDLQAPARASAAPWANSTSTPHDRGLTMWLEQSQDVQAVLRYVLHRQAAVRAKAAEDVSLLLTTAQAEVDAGLLSAAGFAALVDAVVMLTSGIQPSAVFPPQERAYLKPKASPVSQPSAAAPSPGVPSRPAVQARPAPGITARKVAAGAAGAGALLALFSE